MRFFGPIATLIAALTLSTAHASAEIKHDAHGLVRAAQAGIARISSASIDTSRRSHLPFLAALRETSRSLSETSRGLAKRSPGYFSALGAARRSVEKLKLTFEKSGMQNKQVIEGVKSAANAIEVLHKNFGREAARLKEGGQLSDEEKQRFTMLKRQRESIVSKLGALRDASKADAASSKLVHDLDDLISDASRAAAADATASAYIDLLLLVDPLEGEWRGLSLYAPPGAKDEWEALDEAFVKLEAQYNEAAQAGAAVDWKIMERSIDIPAEFEIGAVNLSEAEIEQSLREIEKMATTGSTETAIGAFWDADEEILESDAVALVPAERGWLADRTEG